MEPLYKTQTRITKEEYINYSLTVLRHFLPYRGNQILFEAALAVLAVYSLYKGIQSVFFAAAAVIVLFPLVHRHITKRQIRANIYKNPKLIDRVTQLEFYQDRVKSTDSGSVLELAYDKIYAIYETSRNYYLMLGQNEGIIVVKGNCGQGLLDFLNDLKKKYGKR